MNVKTWLGFALAFAIGSVCRFLDIPVPAPPALIGALLVVAMTSGYVVTDHYATRRAATHESDCGGPTGGSAGGVS